MALSPLTLSRIKRYNPRNPAWWSFRAATSLDVEALALPDESPAQLRALLDAFLADYPPASIGDMVILEQVVVASIDRSRALQARTSLLSEKVRTAELRFDQAQQNEVETYKAMLPEAPARALAGLHQTAAGCRHLISRFERLEAILRVDGTLYGQDRDELCLLQASRPERELHPHSDTAFVTWFYCLLAQPDPKDAEVTRIGDRKLMPKAFQDHDCGLWIPDPPRCAQLLSDLVTHKLILLRARAEWLRLNVEEPARTAARVQARVLTGSDLELLRAEKFHDQAFHQAYQTLLKQRPPAGTPVPPTAQPRPPQPPRPGLFTSPLPPSDAAGGAGVLDFHSTRRAVVEQGD